MGGVTIDGESFQVSSRWSDVGRPSRTDVAPQTQPSQTFYRMGLRAGVCLPSCARDALWLNQFAGVVVCGA
eukprot:9462719-Lingulodinium_polyedra.AAC.1